MRGSGVTVAHPSSPWDHDQDKCPVSLIYWASRNYLLLCRRRTISRFGDNFITGARCNWITPWIGPALRSAVVQEDSESMKRGGWEISQDS